MDCQKQIHELLRDLLRLTQEQSEILRTEEHPGLDENISEREYCIQKLSELPQSGRGDLSDEVKKILTQIREAEELNKALTKRELSELSKKMKKTRDGQTAIKFYDHNDPEVDALYFDKKK
ncbi:MAG: flagellar protein FliT [Oscillospiraceae bacterium]|nr:flagellar protein FliT [Oscillospiraceae bacterium]